MNLRKPEFGPDAISAFSRWCPRTNFATLHVKQEPAGLDSACAQNHGVAYCEQSIKSGGEVTLDDRRDGLGQPCARVARRAGALKLHTIRAYLATLGQIFADRGLGEIVPDAHIIADDKAPRRTFGDRSHHIGGARMAASADNGVVDADLKVFGTTNAYVCSSAVFPSAGFVNPTRTILTLACPLAERLVSG